MNESYLHLKICEGCGRLWLRNTHTYDIYCRRCNDRFAHFPAPQSRSRVGRQHKNMQVIENSGGAR